MKFCVYGAGAIGGYLAVDLALAGHDVTVIARNKNLEAIKAGGLKLIIGGEERVATNITVTDDPATAGPQDYVFIATKAHQAVGIVDMMQPLIGPDTAVITAQNGVPWWYYYAVEGYDEPYYLESVDPGGESGARDPHGGRAGCSCIRAASRVRRGDGHHSRPYCTDRTTRFGRAL